MSVNLKKGNPNVLPKISYLDFYKIAKYANDAWKGNFAREEISNNAVVYKSDYDYSVEKGKVSGSMQCLIRLMAEDMDYYNFQDNLETIDDSTEKLSIEDMNRIIRDYLEFIDVDNK